VRDIIVMRSRSNKH